MRTALRHLALLFTLLIGGASYAAPEMRAADAPAPEWVAPALPDGWVTLRHPGVTVHGAAVDERTLERILAHADAAVPRLADALGVPIGGDVQIYVADTEAHFRDLQPGQTPEWADGTAWASAGAIFLHHPRLRPGGARPLEVVLDHELVHVLLGRVFDPQPVPRWLQEGMAQVYANETGPEVAERIIRGTVATAPLSLESLTRGFPNDAVLADLAYAQSADFILWFRARYGEDTLRALVRQIAAGRTVEGAMLDLTGASLTTLGAVWRERLVSGSASLLPSHIDDVAFGLGAVGLIGLGLSRRRTTRERLTAWRRSDAGLRQIARELLRRRAAAVR